MKRLTKENKQQIVEKAYRRVIEKNIPVETAVVKALEFFRPDTVEILEDDNENILITRTAFDELIQKVENGLKARERIIKQYGEEAAKYI